MKREGLVLLRSMVAWSHGIWAHSEGVRGGELYSVHGDWAMREHVRKNESRMRRAGEYEKEEESRGLGSQSQLLLF